VETKRNRCKIENHLKLKIMKLYAAFIITLFFITNCGAQTSSKAIQKDFYKLSGTWEGSLTYLDYSTGKPYTMKANIEVKRIGKTNEFVFANIYPNEINANSIDTITVSKDGKYIGKELVKSRRKLVNGDIEIITEEFGKDGNDDKPAIFRHTYTLGTITYKNRKDVQFNGETEWINRHEYSYKKRIVDKT
jgi:hypothetical protein